MMDGWTLGRGDELVVCLRTELLQLKGDGSEEVKIDFSYCF